MQPLTNRFQELDLSPEEEKLALRLSKYNLAHLQNKTALVANNLAEFDMSEFESVEKAQLAHIRLRAHLEILEELMSEFSIDDE